MEKVQGITDEGADAEGIIQELCFNCNGSGYKQSVPGGIDPQDINAFCYCTEGSRRIFVDLWNSINTKRGFGWNVNPFVWVLTFKRV